MNLKWMKKQMSLYRNILSNKDGRIYAFPFGPFEIALIILALLILIAAVSLVIFLFRYLSRNQNPVQSAPKNAIAQFCRNCGKELIGNPEFCLSCGARPLIGTSYCYKCGVGTDSAVKKCAECGVRLI
jgi:hypothetical protein